MCAMCIDSLQTLPPKSVASIALQDSVHLKNQARAGITADEFPLQRRADIVMMQLARVERKGSHLHSCPVQQVSGLCFREGADGETRPLDYCTPHQELDD